MSTRKPRGAKPRIAKAKRAPTLAQLLARGKGAKKLPILINRLPKGMKRRGIMSSPHVSRGVSRMARLRSRSFTK